MTVNKCLSNGAVRWTLAAVRTVRFPAVAIHPHHGWKQSIERRMAAAKNKYVMILTLRLSEIANVNGNYTDSRWWANLDYTLIKSSHSHSLIGHSGSL